MPWTPGIWPIAADQYVRDAHIDDLVAAIQELSPTYVPTNRRGYVGLIAELQGQLDQLIGPILSVNTVKKAWLTNASAAALLLESPLPSYASLQWYHKTLAMNGWVNIYQDSFGANSWRNVHPGYISTDMLNDLRAVLLNLRAESLGNVTSEFAIATHDSTPYFPDVYSVMTAGTLAAALGEVTKSDLAPYSSENTSDQGLFTPRLTQPNRYGHLLWKNKTLGNGAASVRSRATRFAPGSTQASYISAVAGQEHVNVQLSAAHLIPEVSSCFPITSPLGDYYHILVGPDPLGETGSLTAGMQDFGGIITFSGNPKINATSTFLGLHYVYTKDYA